MSLLDTDPKTRRQILKEQVTRIVEKDEKDTQVAGCWMKPKTERNASIRRTCLESSAQTESRYLTNIPLYKEPSHARPPYRLHEGAKGEDRAKEGTELKRRSDTTR